MVKLPKYPLATSISQRFASHQTPTQPPKTLPPELWTMIFAFLSASELCRAKLVCRQWRDYVSTTPFRVLCEFYDRGRSNYGRRMVENESIRVGIGRNYMSPYSLDYFTVPGLMPLIKITVFPLLGDWDTYQSDFPLFDTIQQLFLDRCGFNVTLVLVPSMKIKPSRFPSRYGIPVNADSYMVEDVLEAKNGVVSPGIRKYFSAITQLCVYGLEDETRFRNALELMPNIDYVSVYMDQMESLDFGLDTLPSLRNLEIYDSSINQKLLDDIPKLRHLERLQLVKCLWDEGDLEALCDMFTTLPRLLVFSVSMSSIEILDSIGSSEKLRRAMQNITHFVVLGICASKSLNAIETLSRLENIHHIMVYLHQARFDNAAADISAAKARARELRSARLRIDLIL
jgi:hypothetical protein